MKQKMICTLAALIAAATLAGCSGNQASSSLSSSGASSSEASSTPAAPSSSESVSSESSPAEEENGGVSVQSIYEAVKEAYGENYVPSMSIEEQQLREVYGVDTGNVEEFVMEGPMMSGHVDVFAAIKAKEGKGEEIEQQLLNYQDALINDSLQYPMNLAKVNASKVVRHGDYVFFVMLGAFDDNDDGSEEDQAKFAQEQVQIGLDVIESFFK